MNNVNLGYEPIDYSNASISSASSFMSTATNAKVQSPSSSPVANQTASKNGFPSLKLFNFLKPKNQTDQNAINLLQQQQQQQQQKEIQQQKLKQQKTDLKTIGQYIKSFEAIVIKSLRQYTLTTSVNLQTRILELLIQLVFLKVDYCLLDSDKVFIDYVLRQFEYLEQKRSSSECSGGSRNSECDETGSNHLSRSYIIDLYENFDSESSLSDPLCLFDVDTMLNKLFATIHGPQSSSHGAGSSSNLRPDKNFGSYPSSLYGSSSPIISSQHLRQEEHQRNHILIPKLFDFLILLSHEKKTSVSQVSKTNSTTRPGNGLLTIPEIMQLCDNLIASENSPHTHAIPALRPLVIDLFLNRANEDTKEIDLHHDVTFNTLLRLVQYPQMWPLLTIAISKYKRDNQEKWKKTSRQVCDALFDSMRSNAGIGSNLRLKFSEFNGNELRAIRRYSRSYVPHIESLKQLFVLLNCLAPQVFRPIDFIILSFFETSRPYLTNENKEMSNGEMNNWLCIVIVHIYLLLSYTSEEQILIRIHHLMPQIISSYSESITSSTTTLNQNFKSSSRNSSMPSVYSSSSSSPSPLSSSPSSRKHSLTDKKSSDEDEDNKTSKKVESESESNQRDRSESVSTSYSNNTSTSNSSYNKNNVEYTENKPPPNKNINNDGSGYYNDDTELNLNESADFLAKFVLKLIEKPLDYIDKNLKFNSNSYFPTNLSASSPSSLLRDFQTNFHRDINYTQHLIANELLFIMYIVSSGVYPKISNSISLLINDKAKESDSKYSKGFFL